MQSKKAFFWYCKEETGNDLYDRAFLVELRAAMYEYADEKYARSLADIIDFYGNMETIDENLPYDPDALTDLNGTIADLKGLVTEYNELKSSAEGAPSSLGTCST